MTTARGLADARRDYLAGLRDLRAGRTDAAAAALARAAAERPREEARARLVGAIPEPYLPWHYLAIAYARLGRCDEARAAWQRSDAHGVAAAVVAPDDEGATLRARCAAAADAAPRETPSAAVPPTVAPPAEPASPPRAAAPPAAAEEAVAAPAPEALLVAADRFADGDVRGALDALARLQGGSPRERALAQLLAAAAHHALFELRGRRDAGDQRRALAAARAARALAPDLTPDASVFSPRFVDWFAAAR